MNIQINDIITLNPRTYDGAHRKWIVLSVGDVVAHPNPPPRPIYVDAPPPVHVLTIAPLKSPRSNRGNNDKIPERIVTFQVLSCDAVKVSTE